MSDVVIRRAVGSDGSQIGLVLVRTWQATYRGLPPQPFLDGLDATQRGEDWEQNLSEDAGPGETVLVAEKMGWWSGSPVSAPARRGREREGGSPGYLPAG